MQPVLHPDESARLDRETATPVDVLMERAGTAVALAAAEMGASGYGSRVHVATGPGNNGGDGYVAARRLARRGVHVTVGALAAPRGPAQRAAATAAAAGVETSPLVEVGRCDLVIDALFGTGFHGVVPPAAEVIARGAAPVLAVDVPSGLDAATGDASAVAAPAARTVTFHAFKLGHLIGSGPDVCGEIRVADIGLVGGVPELLLCEQGDAPRPRRLRTAHKWSAGSVAVAGGSPGLSGAPLLCARAALAFGAGAVRLLCPAGLADLYASAPEVMTAGVGEGSRFGGGDVGAVLAAAERFDVLVLGPGLGPGCETFVAGIVAGRRGGLIVDADGLNALDGTGLLAARAGDTIITPHAGEFTRLGGGDASHREAARMAAACGMTVLLKGNPTFVAADETWVVTSGGPELATIGTGDVLCGMVAALWGRGLPAAVSARSAAYWHGIAGARSRGGVTAERLADAVAALAGVA